MSNNIRYIFLAVLILPQLLLLGCNDDDTDRINQERNAFLSYLDSNEYTDTDYTELEGGTFRVIISNSIDDSNAAQRTLIEDGDEVALYFIYYVFSVSSKKETDVIYTNDKDVIEELNNKESNYTGPLLNPEYWSTDPLKVTVGRRDILRGIDNALAGCRKGDNLFLLIPSDLAFGDTNSGYFPEETPLYVRLLIYDVVKNP